VYAAFAVILVALAAFSVACFHLGVVPGAAAPPRRSQQLKGFLYVGAVALLGLALAVVVVGLVGGRRAPAEGLALFGLFTYALYLLAALVLDRVRR
jgi:hypothetical protein